MLQISRSQLKYRNGSRLSRSSTLPLTMFCSLTRACRGHCFLLTPYSLLLAPPLQPLDCKTARLHDCMTFLAFTPLRRSSDHNLIFLTGKWFLFWAIGLRLLIAGFKQVIDPGFTLEKKFKELLLRLSFKISNVQPTDDRK